MKTYLNCTFVLILLYLSCILLFSCSGSKKNLPVISKGTLDLSNYDFENRSFLRLDGEWEFYEGKFLNSNILKSATIKPDGMILVPGEWSSFSSERALPRAFGYGTYVLHIKGNSVNSLVLKLLYTGTASEIEYLGNIVYRSGSISSNIENHIPKREPAVIFLSNTPEQFDIIIRVSNYTTALGGLTTSIRLGTKNQILKYTEFNHLRDFFAIGSLLIIGTYHVLVFLGKMERKTYLYFGLFCISNAIRATVAGDNTLLLNFQDSFYLTILRIEYLTLPLGIILSFLYLVNLTEERKFLSLGRIITIPPFILVILYCILSPFLFTRMLIFSHITFLLGVTYAVFILIYGTIHKRANSRALLISFGLFFLLIINDILNRYYIINTIELAQFGFIFFVFSQSYIIISKYSKELSEAENRRRVSESLARELEWKVEERTNELSKQGLQLTFQKTEIENMNILLKFLNEDLRSEIISKKIQEYVSFRFNIQNLILARYDIDTHKVKVDSALLPDVDNIVLESYFKHLELQIQEKSIHDSIIKSNRVFWLRNAQKKSRIPEENILLSKVNCRSLVFIPLFINKKPIAFLYLFIFTPFKIGKNDMHHLIFMGEQIGSSIYNAWLIEETNKNKEITESALKSLKESQNIMIQAEKMAALSQLVDGIAHEINTPIGAIKATAKNIDLSVDNLFLIAPQIFQTVGNDIILLINEIIQRANSNPPIISTREERQNKININKFLKSEGINNSEDISEVFAFLKFSEITDKYHPLWKHESVHEILKLISDMAGLRQKTKMIDISVDKTSKIVYALKAYTSRETNGRAIHFDIISGIENVLFIYENNIKGNIIVQKDYDTDIPLIKCYPDEMNQIWTNLIHNAIQATGGKGNIGIKVKKSSHDFFEDSEYRGLETITVAISDDGSGIPDNIQKKIFDPFFTTKKAGEGSGLGLHICKDIIEKHGGRIRFSSTAGSTTFTVVLPTTNNLN